MLNKKRASFLIYLLHHLGKSCAIYKILDTIDSYNKSSATKAKYYNIIHHNNKSWSNTLDRDLNELEKHEIVIIQDNIVSIKSAKCIAHDIISIDDNVKLAINNIIKYSRAELPHSTLCTEHINAQNATIYTIGYENHDIDSFINSLIHNGITGIADVRKNPVSRKFGFSKKQLASFISKAEIKYQSFPELGILSEDRKNLTTPAAYKKLLDNYTCNLEKIDSSIIERLSEYAKKERIALLCLEQDPNQCHRGRLAQFMRKHIECSLENL